MTGSPKSDAKIIFFGLPASVLSYAEAKSFLELSR